MICRDCLQNCDKIVSDQCVQYTGPDIPLLGICQGNSLSQFEAGVVTALLSLLDGTGITPADVTVENCAFLQSILGVKSPTLSNLLQMLIDGECTLKSLIDQINTQINNNPSFNAACLTGLPANPTRDDILQAAVLLLCNLKATVDLFPSTYVALSDLNSLVTTIVNNIISGGGAFNSRMVPFVAYEYYGPLSNFDGSGIGVPALGFAKVYLCNGGNGTPDKRGRVAVGAIRSIPGGPSLDPAVDPTNPNNPNWALNDKAGENVHLLTVNEIPSHSHTVTDPGHNHTLTYGLDNGGNRFSANWMKHDSNSASRQTQNATTGISIDATGGGQVHNNIQPSIAAYYIMYIP